MADAPDSQLNRPLPSLGTHGEADAAARVAIARLRRGAWALALVLAVGAPAIRGYFGAHSIAQLLGIQAEHVAEQLSLRASAAPDGWMYETNAVVRMLDNQRRQGGVTAARVDEVSGRSVASVGAWDPRALFEHTEAVFDSGVEVARVRMQQSAGPWLATIVETALASLLVALATYALIARVAVHSIERTVRQLQAARHEAERAGAARTVFLATMSHEIRTPMNGVIGMTSLLRDTALSEQQRHYVDVIRGSGESLLRVINEILEFSKVESGHAQLEPHVFQPDLLGEEVLALLEPLSRHKELKLVFEAGAGLPPWVVADANRLRQVLVNLVGNAIKFSERGSIGLRVECPAAGRLRYVVRDEGIGMSAEQLRVVFDAFVQGDASTSRRYGGTGLGLAISRRLVELMGGTIDARSEPGQGSTFTLDLPAAAAPPPQGAGGAGGVEALVGRRVLIVDDSAVNVEIVETMVRGWGMHAVGVTDPVEALARLGADGTAIDVAVLDFNMPGLDGHTLGHRLRELRPDLPLVLLSSKNGAIHDAGLFNARLNKPVLRTLLRDTLRSVLTRTPTREPDTLSHSVIEGLRSAIGAPSLASLRVLVAEDNPVNAMVVGAMLERLGVVCEVVSNGVEAVQAVCRQPYDVVLMDMLMPEMDGLEAARRVRASPGVVQPWIVALTANVMSEDRERCAAAGMDEFLAKPLQLHELEQCLAAVARRAERSAPASARQP